VTETEYKYTISPRIRDVMAVEERDTVEAPLKRGESLHSNKFGVVDCLGNVIPPIIKKWFTSSSTP
jgi:hypothetical protein